MFLNTSSELGHKQKLSMTSTNVYLYLTQCGRKPWEDREHYSQETRQKLKKKLLIIFSENKAVETKLQAETPDD